MTMAYKDTKYKESNEVKQARDELDKNSTYKESKDVKQARNELNNLKEPGEYKSQYQDVINGLMNQISGRKFSYDLNADMLYQQYKDQYMKQGNLAMQDTIGQAAALTGGYGNSYAETVGNQAYQGYLGKLNDVVPQLYQLALDKYNTEGQGLYNQLGMYTDQEQLDYGKYRDAVGDYKDDRSYLYGVLTDTQNRDYTMYGDAAQRAFQIYQQGVAENQWTQELALKQAQLAEDQRQFNANLNLQKKKLSSSGSGSGSSGSSSNTNKNPGDDNPGKDKTFSNGMTESQVASKAAELFKEHPDWKLNDATIDYWLHDNGISGEASTYFKAVCRSLGMTERIRG